MACRLVALDKLPGVCPLGIGKTFRRAIAKPFMRAAGYQVKTTCGSLQLYSGLEAGIEGANHAMVQRRGRRNVQEPEGKADKA